ncbi:putative MFS family arabinose efflux permease [Mucilaginibacter frigoritolerans]|uniref:Putative MFS family arabinose efflux permease n=1 Tax=Mucilaginibacter frigoritolerans TaxID=652788 RepID=A0A562TP90_9SPHI|nr:MFS transporter [Mucilaginibacter frigoritolerans]TWI95048.1 putative MFS family arabinose efflux permease [Mucilaginibacter frigoritolerans]
MIKEKNERIATWLAFSLIPLSGFATDIYIPSLPSMGTELRASSIQVQMTLSVFLISYGISQLFIGGILDSFGRYRLSLMAIVVFTLSCLVIAITHNIYVIYLMRVVHGITVAVIVVSKRAYFVDMFEGDRLKRYLSMFTIIWSSGPIVAPFIGGYLQSIFGWQANFYFLAILAAVLGVLELIYSGETIRHRAEFHLKKIAGVYVSMISTLSFTLGLLMLGFAYCMVMVYNMTGPFIVEHQLHLTPVIAGYCSLILGIAWMIGGFIGKATINRPFHAKMVINVTLQILFVMAMIISINFLSNLYTLLFFAFIIHACAGFTYNNYFTYSLSQFPKNAGIAGGLTGGIVYVIVSFLSYGIVCFIPAKDERNLSFSYFILILLSGIIMFLIFDRYKKSRRVSV